MLEQLIDSLQLIVVLSAKWNATQGSLYLYERDSLQEKWKKIEFKTAVALGEKGLAWADGLHPCEKKEGDLKSPAGIFRLGPLFGSAIYEKRFQKMVFLPINDQMYWVDDPGSPFYNSCVYVEGRGEWKSAEKMSDFPHAYELGVFVQHNTSPCIPHRGSCIFLHVWKDADTPTAGCTAMDKEDLLKILQWLDEKKHPLLIQFPQEEFAKLKTHAEFETIVKGLSL